MKIKLCALVGACGGMVAAMLGGWDTGLQILVRFMIVDYIMGLILAGVFHRSNKTKNGALESRAGFKGLCRKVGALACVMVAYHLDTLIGTDYVRDAVIIGFIANEGISIAENAGLMGVPMPQRLKKAIEILIKKAEVTENEEH